MLQASHPFVALSLQDHPDEVVLRRHIGLKKDEYFLNGTHRSKVCQQMSSFAQFSFLTTTPRVHFPSKRL